MRGLKLALCSALAVALADPSSLRLEPRDSEAAQSARFSTVWPANRDEGVKWFRQKMEENLAETLAKRATAITAAKEKVWHEALKRPEFATLSMNTKKDITVTASNGAQAVLTVHGVGMDTEADMRRMSAMFVTKLMLEVSSRGCAIAGSGARGLAATHRRLVSISHPLDECHLRNRCRCESSDLRGSGRFQQIPGNTTSGQQ